MKATDLCIATMTLVRSPDEDRLLRVALSRLASLGLRIIATDGGSPKEFVQFLKSLRIDVVASREKGLVPQIRASIQAAAQYKSPYILYTEPDKLLFFENDLLNFLGAVKISKKLGAAIAARAPRAFKTFPPAQQEGESLVNRLAGEMFKQEGDYCYGPFVFARELAGELAGIPVDLGWGWRFHIFKQAHARKLKLTHIATNIPCPKEQREESAADRLYRYKQLRQNLEALVS